MILKRGIKSSAEARSAVTQASSLHAQGKFHRANASRAADRRSAVQQTRGLRYFGAVHGLRRGATAFTLVEVLLGLAICAIVLVAINAVFATAVRLRDRTTAGIDENLPVQRTMQVMTRDLKGAVGPGGFLAGDFKCGAQNMGATLGMSGEAGGGGLDFFSDTGMISDKAPWGDIQEVLYELKAPTDRNKAGMDLVRCVNRNLLAVTTQTPEFQTLLSHVETVDFDCFDGSMWRNVWDTSSGDTNLPMAVRIRIHLLAQDGEDASKKAPLELMVPLVTLTLTNQVAGGR
jgi:type II secretion system protein J